MLVAFPQEFASGLQAQRLQTIELLVQTLGSNPNSGLLDLGQPLGTMTGSVDACARTGNGPASVQRFDPIHGAGDVLGDRQRSEELTTTPVCRVPPLGTMTGSVDACARTGNGPASVQRFDPIHGAGDVLGDRQIAAPQLLKGA